MGKVVNEPKEDDVVLLRRTKRALHDSGLLTYLLGSRTSCPGSSGSPKLCLPCHRRLRRHWSIDNPLVGETRRQDYSVHLSKWEGKLCSPDAHRRGRKSHSCRKNTCDQMRYPEQRAGQKFGEYLQRNDAHPRIDLGYLDGRHGTSSSRRLESALLLSQAGFFRHAVFGH